MTQEQLIGSFAILLTVVCVARFAVYLDRMWQAYEKCKAVGHNWTEHMSDNGKTFMRCSRCGALPWR